MDFGPMATEVRCHRSVSLCVFLFVCVTDRESYKTTSSFLLMVLCAEEHMGDSHFLQVPAFQTVPCFHP